MMSLAVVGFALLLIGGLNINPDTPNNGATLLALIGFVLVAIAGIFGGRRHARH